MKYNKKSKAFTIPEALVILLIAALLAVAGVSVMTKKHKDVAVHGRWTCTMDGSGIHYVKSEQNGKSTGWVNSGSSCTFTPPANAKQFLVKAVAGGGSGAGGQSGKEEKIYDSDTDSDTFVTSIKEDGYYMVYGVGGGGGGGGMGCGESKNYYNLTMNKIKTFDTSHGPKKGTDWTWNVSTQTKKDAGTEDQWNYMPTNYADSKFKPSKPYVYGVIDKAVPGFNYELLVKNDEKYTKNRSKEKVTWTNETYDTQPAVPVYDFKYKYMNGFSESEFKNLLGCFSSEGNLPFADYYKKYKGSDYIRGLYLQDSDIGNFICWNLPGKGGKSAGSFSQNNVYIQGGQNIVVNVGRAGKGTRLNQVQKVGLYKPNNTTKTNYDAYIGGGGTAGTSTTVYVGGANHFTASGGSGGYGRHVKYISYKNIPVQECEIVKKEGTYSNNPACSWSSGWDSSGSKKSSCLSKPGCSANRYLRFTSCSGEGSCSSKYSESSCKAGYDTTSTDAEGKEVKTHHSCTPNYEYYTSCSTGTHTGPYYEEGACRIVVRKVYFENTPVCVSTSTADFEGTEIEASIPSIFGTERSLKRFWIGDIFTTQDSPNYSGPLMKHGEDGHGSGGYGIGEGAKTYFEYEDEANTGNGTFKARLYGWDGQEGYASVSRISYTAGGGGQAGQYASTILKKTGKLNVVIGKGGFPGSTGLQGEDGGKTIITKYDGTILLSLDGGKAGLPSSTEAKMSTAGILSGIRGALSPFESPYNKAKIIPYGGKDGTNASFDGVSPSTEKWCGTGGCTGPLVITYGAGGGGGAASKDLAGSGGAGAAGGVVIEW